MTDKVSITFDCPDCGTRLGWPDDATDEIKLSCSGCGKDAGTYKDLREKAMDVTRNAVRDMVKNTLKGR
jgi:endogenous inhibitor of DNA gyrase (YacG/DUF329 family)